jgi:hypothetical protein
MSDSEMLERRCRSWEKTRERGQVLYAVVRGAIFSGLWLLIRIPFYVIGKHGMSYESVAVVSIVVFLMGCYEAPQSWKRAESRYESDRQYLEVMRQHDSKTVS